MFLFHVLSRLIFVNFIESVYFISAFQIPLGCVSLRYLSLALSSSTCVAYFASLSRYAMSIRFILLFSFLLLLKILTGVSLIFYSAIKNNEEILLKQEVTKLHINTTNVDEKEKKESMKQLSDIERYTVYKGKVVG